MTETRRERANRRRFNQGIDPFVQRLPGWLLAPGSWLLA